MGRRTKDELRACGYYEWLQLRDALKAKKKEGLKLTKEEKAVVQFNPTPEKPWTVKGGAAPPPAEVRKIKLGDLPSKDVKWPIVGGSFVCTVKGIPCTDEECMLFCSIEGCPFHGKGYMRSKGLKF